MASKSTTAAVTSRAEARVFGHDPSPVALQLIPRSSGWRLGRTVRYLVGGAILAPVVAILPPHAPWAVAAGSGAALMALRRWRERYTLVDLEGACPRCEASLGVGGPAPLREPHRIACDACGNPVVIAVDPAELPVPGGG